LGQEVAVNVKKRFKTGRLAAIAAACFLVILGGGAVAYYTPVTYVSLDVNPSIEYSVNMFDRVISAEGVNDDGTEILNQIDLDSLKNKSIDEAVAFTIDEIAKEGYLNASDAGIVITTSADNMENADALAKELEQAASDACEKNNCTAAVSAQAVGKKRVEEAKELGVTPGKLNLVEKLQESAEDPSTIDVE
jgi:hypothetical protein